MRKKGAALGSSFVRMLSLRISEALATASERQRVIMTSEVGITVSASEVLRRAIEMYLEGAVTKFQSPRGRVPRPRSKRSSTWKRRLNACGGCCLGRPLEMRNPGTFSSDGRLW